MASVKAPPVPTAKMTTKWNTAAMPARVSSDIAAAACASTLVAPLITLIDRSIIQRTHSKQQLSEIFRTNLKNALRRPLAFAVSTPFLLINTLYFATYTTANLTDTVTSTMKDRKPSAVTAGPAKFLATSTANLSICMYKDARFAKMFGAGAGAAGKAVSQKAVPAASLALFAIRDSMTMFASFNLPTKLGPMMGSMALAQFLAPASVQLLSTPLHLLGLDLYNRPRSDVKLPWHERLKVVRRDWLSASFARMARIIPAYGLGGVVNTAVRKRLMTPLDP